MTTPNLPDAPDGAYVIGGGEWKYGQSMSESIARGLFMPAMPTPDNALDLIREGLLKLPLEALRVFEPFIPDSVEEMFESVEAAVTTILDSFALKPLWDSLLNTLKMIFDFLTDNPLAQCFAGIPTDTGDFGLNLVQGMFGLAGNLWDLLLDNPLVACIADLVDDTGNLLQNFVSGLLTLLGGLWDLLLNNPLAQCLVTWFTGLFGSTGQFLTDFAGAVTHLLGQLAEFLDNPLINGLKDLVDDTGLLLLNVANGAAEALQQLMNLIGLANPLQALEFLQGAVNDVWELLSGGVAVGTTKSLQDIIEALTAWIARIPVVGTLVKYLTQGLPGTEFTPDLAGLSKWAEQLLNTNSNIPAGKLFGTLPPAVLGTIPIGSVSTATPNLLTQGSFLDASNITPANGWVWDSTKNKSGTGGSAQINCATTTGTRQLYSNQSIPVAAGDRIGVSTFVNTSGFNGSTISLQIGLVSFAGKVQKSTYLLGSRGGSNNAWGELTNGSLLWEVPKAVNAVDQITSVQMTIAVGNSATAGTVNWDDASLWKGGLMQQSLVEYLVSMTNGLLGGLSTAVGTTAAAFNLVDPWNYTLQAGAAARQQANTGVANAATASGAASAAAGAAATADGKAVATNQAVFGQDVYTPGTEIRSEILPATVGAVGSGLMMRRTTAGETGIGPGRNPLFVGYFNASDNNTSEIVVVQRNMTTGSTVQGVQVKTDGWYLVEVCLGVKWANGLAAVGGTNSSLSYYQHNWNLAPLIVFGPNAWNSYATTGRNLRVGTDIGNATWADGSTTFGNKYGWSARYAQSSFIVYLTTDDYVMPGYDLKSAATGFTGISLSADGSGQDNYMSVALLNRSLA